MEQIARTPDQLGAIIRRRRRAARRTQAELGSIAGLRQETISKIETGQGATRIDTLCDLLAALDLELVVQPRSRAGAGDIEDIF